MLYAPLSEAYLAANTAAISSLFTYIHNVG